MWRRAWGQGCFTRPCRFNSGTPHQCSVDTGRRLGAVAVCSGVRFPKRAGSIPKRARKLCRSAKFVPEGLDLTLPKDAANPPWCKLPPDTGQTDGF